MSVSGGKSGDTRSAVFNLGSASNATNTVQDDAEEDREIVGAEITFDLPSDNNADVIGKAFVGVDPRGGAQSVGDGGFYFEHRAAPGSDDTNGGTSGSEDTESIYFGHGHGFDWNEDVTLTVELSENTGNAVGATVVIYYRDL